MSSGDWMRQYDLATKRIAELETDVAHLKERNERLVSLLRDIESEYFGIGSCASPEEFALKDRIWKALGKG